MHYLSERFKVQYLFLKNHLFHYMVFWMKFFSYVHPRRPSLQEGGSWDVFLMQLGPTSHGHIPNGEKKWFNKINCGPTSSQNTFACFLGENI